MKLIEGTCDGCMQYSTSLIKIYHVYISTDKVGFYLFCPYCDKDPGYFGTKQEALAHLVTRKLASN